jgi:3-dehydroquinate synthetase
MQTLNVALAERSYPIHIGAGLLARPELIVDELPQKKAVIVTNTTIAPLYLAPFQRVLEARGVSTVSVTLPDGESHKNWKRSTASSTHSSSTASSAGPP